MIDITMIDITIEEAMRCLQIFQEQQPENGYTFSCFNLALSALKTIEDMQLNGNFTPLSLNISREIIAKLAEFKCPDPSCKNCVCAYKADSDMYNCVSSNAIIVLSDYSAIMRVYEWLQSHPDIVAQWKEEIERSENNE